MDRTDLIRTSEQIDHFFDLGDVSGGTEAIERALEATRDQPAFNAFFQAEAAGYIRHDSREQGRLFQEAQRLDPEDLFFLRTVGIWQLMNGKVWAAVKTFDRVLAIDAKDADTIRCMGIAHSRLDRDRKAITFYQESLKINPKDSDAFRQIGVSYSKLGEDREALEWFRKALQYNELDYDAMRQLGISLAMLEDYDGALEWLRLAQTINPNDYETRLNTALVLKKMRHEESWFERVSIKLGRAISRLWGKLLDAFGLR